MESAEFNLANPQLKIVGNRQMSRQAIVQAVELPVAFSLSRRTVHNIRQNILLSLAVIAFLVPAALAGWIGMVPGLLINEAGGLVVIINGLRLLRNRW